MRYAKFLVPLLIILAIVFYIFERNVKKPEKGIFGNLGEYYFVDSQSIDRVELKKNDTLIAIARQNGNWIIEKPVNALADPEAVSELITNIISNPVHRILNAEESIDKSEYGLDNENETITLYSGGKTILPLILGDNSITGSDFYAMKKDGNEVMLTAIQLKDNLKYELEYYRSKNPLVFDENSISTILFTYANYRLRLEKRPDTKTWFITEPEQFLAQNAKVVRFLEQLKRMEVVKFLNKRLPAEDSHGLETPSVKLELFTDKNETIEMLVGDVNVAENGFYARISQFPNEDFIVEASMLAKLNVKFDDFKETSLFQIEPSKIISIDVREKGSANLSIYRDKTGTWKRIKPSSSDIDEQKLSVFFQKLRDLRPSKYITKDKLSEIGDDALGFSNYKIKVEIKCKKGTKDLEITIGNETPEGYFVFIGDMDGGAYLISAEFINAFIDENETLKTE